MSPSRGGADAAEPPWWRSAVVYQIYPRSFADANGDGIGDLQGIRSRLDHLQWLGVDAVWLGPVHPSPNGDWGYDVADYNGIHPELGSLDDFDQLVADAAARGIRVMLDLVPNHTSDRHPWFTEARASRESPRRDWYVWGDVSPDGRLPNNWLSMVGQPAWSRDDVSGQHYLHNFFPCQPDLNWWNPQVRAAFDQIIRFWLDRGVAGFRIDVAQGIVKDALLRDNPPATVHDMESVRRFGQRQLRNTGQPEVHEVLRRWRAISDRYDGDRVLLGETVYFDLAQIAACYGSGDELQLPLDFPFYHASLDAAQLRDIVEASLLTFPEFATPAWFLSSHDGPRVMTRWCGNDEKRMRCALLILLDLPGAAVLYYGDEIGMPDTDIPAAERLDPAGLANPPGRDGSRTPMHWEGGPGAGFTTPGARPWLRFGDQAACNVAAQRDDPGSMLHLTRRLLQMRRQRADLRLGGYRSLASPDGAWAWRRGEATVVAVNLSDQRAAVPGVAGRVVLSTVPGGEGGAVEGVLELSPWEGVIVAERPG